METILLDANGLCMDAVLLAAGRDRMRVVLRDGNDTLELRWDDGRWVAEDGRTFQFEAWIAGSYSAAAVPSCEPSPPLARACGEMVNQQVRF